LEAVKSRPFVFVEKEVIWGWVAILGKGESVKKWVMMAQFARHIGGYDFCVTVADTVDTTHNCLSPAHPLEENYEPQIPQITQKRFLITKTRKKENTKIFFDRINRMSRIEH
jgi:hypothetical protein